MGACPETDVRRPGCGCKVETPHEGNALRLSASSARRCVPVSAIPQVLIFSGVKRGTGKELEQIRIPRQILFACLRVGFAFLCHYYG